MAESDKENGSLAGSLGREPSLLFAFSCQLGPQAAAAQPPSRGTSPALSTASSLESVGSLGCMPRLPSLEPPPCSPAKACAKQLNMKLMHASSVQDIIDLATSHLGSMDAINLTAAYQRLAKLTEGGAAREAVLSSSIFHTMTEMLIEECNTGRFNSQSTSNAWWAVCKLVPSTHALFTLLLHALETALLGCLASSASEAERPNSQAVSSIFYAWGRLDGYLPGGTVLQLMWERTLHLALTFDTQGVANILWSLGMIKKKYGDAFAIRTDVLSALGFLLQRIVNSMAVQGLSCAAIGCANMGPSLRCSVTPLMEAIIAESLKRPQAFTFQAMANLAVAISRIGHGLAQAPQTHLLLAAFDMHAASLPPPHRPQEHFVLYSSMLKCGFSPCYLRAPGFSVGPAHGRRVGLQGGGGAPQPQPPQPYASAGPGPQLHTARSFEMAVGAYPHPYPALGVLPNGLLYHHHHAAAAAAACFGPLPTPFAAAGGPLPSLPTPFAAAAGPAFLPAPSLAYVQPAPPPIIPPPPSTLLAAASVGSASITSGSPARVLSTHSTRSSSDGEAVLPPAGEAPTPSTTPEEPAPARQVHASPAQLQTILQALQALKLQQDLARQLHGGQAAV